MPGWKSLLALAAVAVITTAVAIIGTCLFLGLGSLLAWLSPLTLVQALYVTIGATIAMSLVANALLVNAQCFENDDEEDLDDDFDFGEEEDEDPFRAIDVEETTPQRPKTGRNDPCPCGSGKKYKRCCGT